MKATLITGITLAVIGFIMIAGYLTARYILHDIPELITLYSGLFFLIIGLGITSFAAT